MVTHLKEQISKCKINIDRLHYEKQAKMGRRLTYVEVAKTLNIPLERFYRVIGGQEKKPEWQKAIASYYAVKTKTAFPKATKTTESLL